MTAPDFEAAFSALLTEKRESAEDVDAAVAGIIAEVRARGDAALAELTQRFDGVALSPGQFLVSPEERRAAVEACDAEARAALALAAARIEAFHARQRPTDIDYVDETGMRLASRWRAVGAAGLYVPGGTAAYPSSVLMNAIPARVAGVERVVMTVPAPGGVLNPLVLAAAELAGIDEVYRIGGAQAIAALAYGTATIAPVDKIVGPGNAFVAAAKRRVFGTVGIDLIAGPSEIVVIADAANDPDWIAADLLSQAEHDAAAQAILITDDAGFAERVVAAAARQLETLPRRSIASASWEGHGAVIVVADLAAAAALANRLAPEHVELAVSDPEPLASTIRDAGAIFLGRLTPEAIGDYIAGPNHVLPTARSARFSSGLGVLDFMKRTSWVGCAPKAIAAVGPAAVALARAEGLDAHAHSVALRLRRNAPK